MFVKKKKNTLWKLRITLKKRREITFIHQIKSDNHMDHRYAFFRAFHFHQWSLGDDYLILKEAGGGGTTNFVGTDEYFLSSLVRPVNLYPSLPKSEYLFLTAKRKPTQNKDKKIEGGVQKKVKIIPELWNRGGKTLARTSDLLREPKRFSRSIKKHYSEIGHVRSP